MHSNEELKSRALTNIDDMNDSAAFQPLAMPSLLFQRSAMLNSITAGEDADPVDNATIVQGFVNSNPLPSPVQPREIMDFDVSSVDLSQLQQPRMVPVQRNTHATRSRTHRSNAPSPEKSPLLTSIYDHMKAVEELSLDAEPASVPARGVQLRATQAHVTTLVEAPTAAAPAQRKIRTSTRTSGRKRKQSPVTASGCESPLQLLTSIPMSESSEKSSSDQGLPVDKRERNKISAARYRKKRKTYITSLEKEVNMTLCALLFPRIRDDYYCLKEFF
jgi:hypothetical protein